MNELASKVKKEYQSSRFGRSIGNKLVYEANVEVFKDWANGIDRYGFGNREIFLSNTKLYSKEFNVDDIDIKYEDTITGVINEDCMVVAQYLVNHNYKPALLNLASRFKACGGYESGMNAQEEAICRCSNLSQSLYQFVYPTYHNKMLKRIADANVKYKGYGYPLDINFGGIYTKDVTFFRNNAKYYYDDLKQPFKCDVISVSALSFRGKNFASGDETMYQDSDGGFTKEGEEIQLNKIRTIFRMAIENGNDSLILGAFGCGVYKLPVKDVARQFKQVMEEKEFKNKFKLIVFAILASDKNNDKYIPFYETFGTYKID